MLKGMSTAPAQAASGSSLQMASTSGPSGRARSTWPGAAATGAPPSAPARPPSTAPNPTLPGIPSDGEVSKPSFAGYITDRLGGLQTTTEAPKSADNAMNYPILNEEYPGFMAQYNSMYRTMWMPRSIPRDLVDAAVERTRNER